MVRPGDMIAGKYRVESVLGRGGMGLVVSATHLGLDQAVAVKFLRSDICVNPTAVARFMREARATTRMESDHVVRVLDLGLLEGAPYIVMELLPGRTLAQEIQIRGAVPVDIACRYLLQACDALGEAHSLGIVHRDLKPGNLFLAHRRSGQIQLKVLDFGVSKMTSDAYGQAEPSLTDTHAILGTPLYVSPEQLANSSLVDARTDVWALGVILYELLSGEPPFAAPTISKLFTQIAKAPPPPFAEARKIPEALAAIVFRCLAKEPAERLINAAALGLELAAFSSLPPDRAARLTSFADHPTLPPNGPEEILAHWARKAEEEGPTHAPTAPTYVGRRPGARPPEPDTDPDEAPRTPPETAGPPNPNRERAQSLALGLAFAAGMGLGWLGAQIHVLSPARPLESPALRETHSTSAAPEEGTLELMAGASPAEARLFLDGRPLQGNPHLIVVPKDHRIHHFRAEAPGYESSERMVVFDRDLNLSVALQRTTSGR